MRDFKPHEGLLKQKLNKIQSQFLLKGTNFDLIPEAEINTVQNVINCRPMNTLNWSSPAELSKLHRSDYCFNTFTSSIVNPEI